MAESPTPARSGSDSLRPIAASGLFLYRTLFHVLRIALSSSTIKVWSRNSLQFGNITPFVSDIDLSVLCLGTASTEIPMLRARLKRLKKIIPVLGETNIYTQDFALLSLRHGNPLEMARDPLLPKILREVAPDLTIPSREADDGDKLVFLARMLEADFENLIRRPSMRTKKWNSHLAASQLGPLPEPFGTERLLSCLDLRLFRRLSTLPLWQVLDRLSRAGSLEPIEEIYRDGTSSDRLALLLLFPIRWLKCALRHKDVFRALRETRLLSAQERSIACSQLKWELTYHCCQFGWLDAPARSDEHLKWILITLRYLSVEEERGLRDQIARLGAFNLESLGGDFNPAVLSPTFCANPWWSLEIESNGQLRACPLDTSDGDDLNLRSVTLNDAWNAPKLSRLRQQMQNGEWAELCRGCAASEVATGASLRTRSNRLFSGDIDCLDTATPRPVTAILRLGNTCDLECLICGPGSSSSIYRRVRGESAERNPDFSWYRRRDFWTELEATGSHLKRIVFAGGDAFSFSGHFEILERLGRSPFAANLELHYRTNGLTAPEPYLMHWKHFKRISVEVCLDEVGERDSYLRFSSDWAKVLENLHRLDRSPEPVEPMISFFVHALNAHRLPDLAAWVERAGFRRVNSATERRRPKFELVQQPGYMSIQSCPPRLKAHVRETLIKAALTGALPDDEVQPILLFMSSADTFDFRSLQRLHALDRLRGTNFDRTFPELVPFFETEKKASETP